MNAASERNYNLDTLRIMACIAVIAIHSIDYLLYHQPIDSSSWIFANVVQSFSRWAVPLFVMISGALMINSDQSKVTLDFYSKRIKKIIIPLLFWSFTYWLVSLWTLNGKIDFDMFLKSLAEGNPYPWHLYFLFVILGLYLITPLINKLVKRTNRRQLLVATLIAVAFAVTWETISFFTTINLNNAVTQFLPYSSYYMLGYYISTSKILNTKKQMWGFAGLSLIIATTCTIVSANLGLLNGLQMFSYFNPVLMLSSVCLFMIILKSQFKLSENLKSTVKHLSSLSFGVYLIHLLIIEIVLKLFSNNYSIVLSIVTFLLAATGSFALVHILHKTKFFRLIVP